MSKKLFGKEEVEELSKNPYVQSVSPKGITYTEAFKEIFITSYKEGKLAKEIFENHGFRIEVLGIRRIKCARDRWCNAYKKSGAYGLKDGRKDHPGMHRIKDMTMEDKNARLKAENHMLRAENELLKNIEIVERRLGKK